METVTLKIKDKNKFQHFLAFIKDLDYVEVLRKEPVGEKESAVSENDFFALAGMWEDRDISDRALRNGAWPRVK